MDQEKIGRLIAKLRKEKGLTQTELGDKVGVGFKAVSKWERGITCPDISIINDLSKILGITADELLTGELNSKNTEKEFSKKTLTKISKKIIAFILIISIIILLGITIITMNKNRVYSYILATNSQDYFIEGNAIFKGNNMTISINKLIFNDNEFLNTVITNYEYKIESNDLVLYVDGNIAFNTGKMENPETIKKFISSFSVYYNSDSLVKREKVIKDGLLLRISFLTDSNKFINKDIAIKFEENK